MSADLKDRTDSGHISDPGEAFYFGSGDHQLFGWLHRPAGTMLRGTGLVICKPFGFEAICSHNSLRAFAAAAAGIGIPVLRFDYLGAGDSADIDPQADQIDVWSQNVLAAIGELQRRTGVERVCLLGIRLGGLLATIAAARCKSVNGLILIAPIISGRRYLRELRTTRLAALHALESADSPNGLNSDDLSVNDGSMEASGFFLSAATLAALARVDMTTMDAAACRWHMDGPTRCRRPRFALNMWRCRDWSR